MKTSKNKIKSLMLALVLSVAAISAASARVCFLPDSTDCGSSDVVGGGDVIIPCKYKTAGEVPLNSAYQEPYKSGMCYYARCKISKSTCEANNGKNKKCCKFDDASGCYYMGDCPKEECPADYIYSAEQAADRKSLLNCSCNPCLTDASKWKCTCPEECSKIEPVGTYTNKCDESQIPHIAEGVIGSNGQCYTCEDKPVGCTYEYRQATTEDSCGLRDFENTSKCMDSINGCQCYTQLIKVSSLSASAGTVTPINKISNKSATCVDENNVTRYQTICEGTAKSQCEKFTNHNFVPNGCVSDTYNNGFEVKGDEFGSCQCSAEYNLTKEEADQYDTNCYKCSSCAPIGSSQYKYKCELKSGYQIVNGKCENICSYEYVHLTKSDINGITSDIFDINTRLYNDIQNHRDNTKGIYAYSVGQYTNRAANRIDKTSKTCTRADGTIAYEKVCEGTIKAECSEKFESNGCFSEGYRVETYDNGNHYRLNVETAEFGYCGCDSDKGLFGTEKACKDASQLNCYAVKKCYQTCEAGGMYSTKEKCEEGLPGDSQCVASSTCYARRKFGWGIHYSHDSEKYDYRNYNCDPKSGTSTRSVVGWEGFVAEGNSRAHADDIKGILTDLYKNNPSASFYIQSYPDEVRFNAGKYNICVSSDYESVMVLDSIYLTSGSGEQCNYTWNSTSNRWEVSSSANYCKGLLDIGDNHTCITANFEDGEEYYIGASLKVTDDYKCCTRRYKSDCNP